MSARSSFRKPVLFPIEISEADLLRPVPAKGEAALAAPSRTLVGKVRRGEISAEGGPSLRILVVSE